jgi:hypothetical protein
VQSARDRLNDVFTGRRGRADLTILGLNVEIMVLCGQSFELHIEGQLAGNGLNSWLA